ncbi:MAG: M56 family metallopeptidase, partial [Solirubrobacterales bacterium]
MFEELIAKHPWLWTLAWQSALCLAAGLVGSHLLRRRAVRAHQVLLLGLIAAVLIPAISEIVKQNHWGLFVAERAVPLPERRVPPSQPALAMEPRATASSMTTAPRPIESVVTTSTSLTKRLDCTRLAMLLWLLASSVLLLRLASQFFLAWRLVKRSQAIAEPSIAEMLDDTRSKLAVQVDVFVRCDERVRSPIIWCWGRRPTLLLPTGSCEREDGLDWPSVICHELAHWKRRDHIHGLVAELLVCAMPWQPLAWWTRRRLETLSEEACDDWVIASGQVATRYARTLLDLLPQSRAALVPGVVSSRSGLSSRVRRILHDTCGNPRPGLRWSLAAFLFCGGFSLGVAFAQTRPASQAPGQPNVETQAPAASEPLNKKDKILLRFVDAEGQPVSGAQVARYMSESEHESSNGDPVVHKTYWAPPTGLSDTDGLVTLEAGGVFSNSAGRAAVYVLHSKRGIGAIQRITREAVNQTLTVSLKPVCWVHGVFESTGLAAIGMSLNWTGAGIYLDEPQTRSLLGSSSIKAPCDLDFLLPAGEYTLACNGSGSKKQGSVSITAPTEPKDLTVVVPEGQSVLDLGVIDLAPGKLANLIGHPAPDIGPMKEWMNGSPVTLAGLRGQTVWLHFGCDGSSYGYPLQRLIDLHNDYADQGVTIIAIYNVDSMAELKEGLARANYPVDLQKIPFRIAIEGRDPAVTYARYDTKDFDFPTDILIDPAGNIVGRTDCSQARELISQLP